MKRLKKYTISEVKDYCKARGIICTSKVYEGRHAHLNCRCVVCGNKWSPRFGKIQAGQGCPKCALKVNAEKRTVRLDEMTKDFKKLNLEVIRELPRHGRERRFEFRCLKCENVFAANPHAKLHSKTGCKKCGMRLVGQKLKLSLSELDKRLAQKGVVRVGEFISTNANTKMKYILCGHLLEMTPNSVFRARSCPKCAGHVRVTEDEYIALAKQFNGEIVIQGGGVSEKSLWRCEYGHEFESAYSDMKYHNRFCPKCFSSHSEEVTRTLAEHLLGVRFPKIKLRKLRASDRYPLELDMYNEDLKLAIEHNGEQHYKLQKNWGGLKALRLIQKRDEEKRLGCKKLGIELLEVRSLGNFTSLEQFRDQLRTSCESLGISLPSGFETADLVDISRRLVTPAKIRLFEELRSKAIARDYTLLENHYKGSKESHSFRCPRGHLVSIQANKFMNGRGCTKCPKVAHNKVAVEIEGAGRFESIKLAAKFLGVNDGSLSDAIKNGKKCRGRIVYKVAAKQMARKNC